MPETIVASLVSLEDVDPSGQALFFPGNWIFGVQIRGSSQSVSLLEFFSNKFYLFIDVSLSGDDFLSYYCALLVLV